jgi:hypothetical protein
MVAGRQSPCLSEVWPEMMLMIKETIVQDSRFTTSSAQQTSHE